MAKKKYDEQDGVWRTIGGRRVFIRKGQSLSDAMKESGKFKTGNRREVQQAIAEQKIDKLGKKNTELYKEHGAFADTGDKERNKVVDKAHKKWLENAKEANELKDMYSDYSPLGWEKDTYNNPKEYTGDISDLDGKHVKKMNWREQIKRNNAQMETELENYKKSHDISREPDDYYEIFRNNERRNAKIKQEVPEEPYEYVEAYAGYRDKSYKLAGTKMEGKDVVEYGRKSWTGKEYTNDEFMEHLTDSNWHQERKMLEEAKLTNQELAYIKDRTKLSQWSVGEELTGSKNTQKMIDEAKAKFSKKNDYNEFVSKVLEDDKIRLSDKYENRNGVPLKVVAKDVSDRYIVNEAGNEYRVKEDELRKILKDGEYKKVEYSGKTKDDLYQSKVFGTDVTKMDKQMKDLFGENFKYAEDISPMSEWSDTTGTGFSDLQSSTLKNKYKGTYQYLQETTNMSGTEILELLKKIDEDKK